LRRYEPDQVQRVRLNLVDLANQNDQMPLGITLMRLEIRVGKTKA